MKKRRQIEKLKASYTAYTVIFKCLDAGQNRRRRSGHAERPNVHKKEKLNSLYTVIFKCLDAEQNRRRRSGHAGRPNVHKKSKNGGEVSTFRAFKSVDTPSKNSMLNRCNKVKKG